MNDENFFSDMVLESKANLVCTECIGSQLSRFRVIGGREIRHGKRSGKDVCCAHCLVQLASPLEDHEREPNYLSCLNIVFTLVQWQYNAASRELRTQQQFPRAHMSVTGFVLLSTSGSCDLPLALLRLLTSPFDVPSRRVSVVHDHLTVSHT